MSKSGKTTLNEVMGKRGAEFHEKGLELHDLPSLLGERMPKLEYHALGRIRLIRALRERFGSNYRTVPGVHQVISKFDDAAKKELEYHKVKKHFKGK